MKNQNPFNINSGISQKFCNRETETSIILNNISQSKNTYIVSKNGIGKTTLSKHILGKLKKKLFVPVYLDINEIINSDDPLHAFYYSLLSEITSAKDQNNNGNKENSPDFSINELKARILELVRLQISNSKKVVIVLDNYRDLSKYPFSEILSEIINISKIIIIYVSVFNYPIFENVRLLNLENLSEDIYSKHLSKQFAKQNRSITKKSLKFIFSITDGDTYTIQLICSRLWATESPKINYELTRNIYADLLTELESGFRIVENLLSPYQLKLLKAIASEKKAEKITSKEFIEKYKLNAPSSVKTALNSMLDKEIVYKAESYYQLQNKLFERYLNSRTI